ncbi:MAG: CocE/NonD family hydrolase [Bryobacteraceae bacterium]
MSHLHRFLLLTTAVLAPLPAQTWDHQDVLIPMRDGVKLHTEIWRDKDRTGPLPILIQRTPYGVKPENSLKAPLLELVKDGYIFVFQDIRGRYKSEGEFAMNRPLADHRDKKAIDESTDTYDTIDWLVKNVPANNGRAGIFGISYGGFLTVMALVDPHPALKAASEQASPADIFWNDDFHHNGAFRLSYGFEYSSMMETGKENHNFQFDTYDTYEWYLKLGSLKNANKRYLDGQRPTWNNFVSHPNYDAFWKKYNVPQHLKNITVPNLNVAGWFDQEDFFGPIRIYEEAEKTDVNHKNFLVSGPWNHGGWSRGDGKSLGKIDFGSDTAKYFRESVQAPWFAYWLKDEGKGNFPEALTFQTGSNEWKSYDAWPPVKNITKKPIYLQASGKLSFTSPTEAEAYDAYVSDPAHPVPYRQRPIPPTYQGPGWTTWHADDQRFVDGRPDVLTFRTDPLTEDVSIAGRVIADFFASTSGTDSDWIVKLIDVYPGVYAKDPPMGGYQLMIAADVLRGRFRDSLEEPKALKANQVTAYSLDLLTHNHRFLKGHRIMVQVQSTWFPVIDRNPQTFVPSIYDAADSDYQKATQKIFRSKRYPSRIVLPVEN